MKKIFLLFLINYFFNVIIGHYDDDTKVLVPRLLIKIPTRQRPQQFFTMLNGYYQKISGQYPYFFLISCDSDDQTMNNPEIIQRLELYPNLKYRFGNNKSKIEAYNADIEEFKDQFDIIIVTSDDMEAVVESYDKIIVQKMLHHFPDFSGVLSFADGFNNSSFNTYPIMGIHYYKRFNYVYFPGYKSFFCDNELTEVSRFIRKEARFNIMLFRHRFMWHGSDSLYEKNLRTWDQDHILYYERRRHNFFITVK